MKDNPNPLLMLIDDNNVDVYLTTKLLNLSNITNNVISFNSANEALTYLNANAGQPEKLPMIIFLDIQMPEKNGFEFLVDYDSRFHAEMKEKIRIYLLSSSSNEKDVERAKANPYVAEIFKKPLNVQQLKQSFTKN